MGVKIEFWAIIPLFFACQATPTPKNAEEVHVIKADTLVAQAPARREIDLDTSQWTDLAWLGDAFSFDLRYATPDNFTGEIIYPCGRCLLRPAVAEALLAVSDELRSQGYGLLLYDCYRPHSAQWKLWKIKPDRRYVTDPEKGSMHNRGGAVDLTLTDPDGAPLDMGTAYDFFGPEAWHTHEALPDSVLQRRRLLRAAMESHGFAGIRTEWWHYSYKKQSFPLSDYQWPCPED